MLSRYARKVCLIAGLSVLAVSAVFAQAAKPAAGAARPISDFVSAQGSFAGHQFIWGNGLDELFRVDYSGSDAKRLIADGGPDVHTSFSGSIVEQKLPDGRALDTIHLVTTNAIAFVVDGSDDAACAGGFIFCPALFGYNYAELVDGIGKPVLVNSTMEVALVNTAPGAPIPDLIFASFTPSDSGAYVKTITVNATTTGPLRAAFGVPDGTRGLATLNVTID